MKSNNKSKEEKKLLYCASSASHILNFHLPYLRYFREAGWHIDVVVAGATDIPYANNVIEVRFEKRLLSPRNLVAIYHINRLLVKNQYDIVSVHTTLAGAVVRAAVALLGKKRNCKVVYTSHGYFFSERGGALDWVYLCVEKLLASKTDLLMVMNRMDYLLATRYRLCKKITTIQGMGVDFTKFTKAEKENKRRMKLAAGFKADDFLIVYVAEMSKRKNQCELIKAFALLAAKEPNIKLLLAGDGIMKNKYYQLACDSGYGDRIFFLGHVSDIVSLFLMCDLAVSTSRCEGLPFNIMEAMACGLPVVASRIKGHIDLLESLDVDCLYNLGDEQALVNRVEAFYLNEDLREQVGKANLRNVYQYNIELVKPKIIDAYKLVYHD